MSQYNKMRTYSLVNIMWKIYTWFFTPVPKITLEKVDFSRYKIEIQFPDRKVSIQFRRPRGPIAARPIDKKPELFPYLQNDWKTPIEIFKNE